MFQRLAIFQGGCALETAEAVCGGGEVAAEAVLDLLGELVRKSLLVLVEQGEAVRYRLLETVRQYAQERLSESGEPEAVAERHALYYLQLAEASTAAVRSPGEGAWLARLEQEHDNLRAALAWASSSERPAEFLRLAGALS
jgi:predicted ATPase